jgi:hypothetical protein
MFVNACSQNGRYYRRAKKNYERGYVETAVSDACRSLRIKPDSQKTQELLVLVWNQALKNHKQTVADLIQRSDTDNWDKILREHEKLKELATQVENLPPLVNPTTGYRVMLSIPDLTNEIKLSRENAAEAHYQAGIRFNKMSRAVDIQRKAANEFKAAMSFIPEYKDASLKYEQSRKLAIRRIGIAPFSDKSNSRNRYGNLSELISDYIISRIMEGGGVDEFTEIIARSQMEAVFAEQQLNASGLVDEASTVKLGQLVGAHEVLSGSISQIVVSPARTVSVVQTSKAKVVVSKEEYVDEDGKTKERDVMGEVSCDFMKYTKTASVTVLGSFSLVDVETGRILLHESLEGKTPWQDSWCRKLRGDSRALSQATKRLIDKAEPFPPEDSELVWDTLRNIGNNVVSKLRSYLN